MEPHLPVRQVILKDFFKFHTPFPFHRMLSAAFGTENLASGDKRYQHFLAAQI